MQSGSIYCLRTINYFKKYLTFSFFDICHRYNKMDFVLQNHCPETIHCRFDGSLSKYEVEIWIGSDPTCINILIGNSVFLCPKGVYTVFVVLFIVDSNKFDIICHHQSSKSFLIPFICLV